MNKKDEEQFIKRIEEYGAYTERLRMITWLKSFQNLNMTVTLTRGDDSQVTDIFGDMIATLERQPKPRIITDFEKLKEAFPGDDKELTAWLKSQTKKARQIKNES